MTDRESLHAAILDDPSDDTTRLVLADLLRESDDPDAQARGRFLWAGVTAHQFRHRAVLSEPLYLAAQHEIAAVAAAGHPARWLAGLGIGPRRLTKGDWLWDTTFDRVTIRIGDSAGVFARGMLTELALTLDEWYAVAEAAVRDWPVGLVTIPQLPGLAFRIDPPKGDCAGWRLTAALTLLPRTTPSRPRGVFGRLRDTVFRTPASDVRPPSPQRWTGTMEFPDRAALTASVVASSFELVEECRDAAGGNN